LGTKGEPDSAERGWPWSSLGLAPTSDREAIHTAYTARKAVLDAQVMRVSAFAELSEAREKALFLAAEMRRAVKRGEEPEPVSLPSPPRGVVVAPSPEKAPAEPEPEPEITISASVSVPTPSVSLPVRADVKPTVSVPPPSPPVPELSPEDESDEPGPNPIEDRRVSVPVTKDREPDPKPEPEEDSNWEHGGGYKPEVDFQDENFLLDAVTGKTSPIPERSSHPTLQEEAHDLAEWFKLKERWPFVIIPVFFLMAMCSGGDEEEVSEYYNPEPYDAATVIPDKPESAPPALNPGDANAMVATLFGPAFDYPKLVDADTDLAWQLAQRIQADDPSYTIPRAQLRTRILSARAQASREQSLAIGELYLAWLKTAQAQEEGGCREVTSGLFFEGIPNMRDDWIGFEQSLAAQLALEGVFALGQTVSQANAAEEGTNPNALPSWALDRARAATELEAPVFIDALNEISHPARCRVEIAVLDALLARPDEVTPAMIAAL